MAQKMVSSEEMQAIDKQAIFDFGIPSIVLMENAGFVIYIEAKKMLEGVSNREKKVLILCGKGNNGGDGMVAARHLVNEGVSVSVYMLCEEKRLKKDPLINFNIIRKMGLSISCIKGEIQNLNRYNLIIDGIFGTGFTGNPDKLTGTLIKGINNSNIPVLSIDVPSGLDATTGECQEACINATKTITFGLAKCGFYSTNGQKFTGEIVIKNIGFPKSLLNHQPT